MKFDPIFWYFFKKGIMPAVVFSLAATGAYALIRTAFGGFVGLCSLPFIAVFMLIGLYKTAEVMMK